MVGSLPAASAATPPVGDPSHARAALGWTPEIGFEELIAEMVAADLADLRAGGAPEP